MVLQKLKEKKVYLYSSAYSIPRPPFHQLLTRNLLVKDGTRATHKLSSKAKNKLLLIALGSAGREKD